MRSRCVDPRPLRAFVAVAREGNISRAADALHLSQPAVSLQLKYLAEFTGLQLFERTPHGVALTQDGAALLPHAENTLQALADFGVSAFRLGSAVRGTLRVGTILDPEFIRLGGFLRALVNAAPDVQPDLRHGMSGDVLTGLMGDSLDVGWHVGVPDGRADRHAIHSEPLARLGYCVVAPAGWGPQVIGRDWQAIARLPWIVTPAASIHARLLHDQLAPMGIGLNGIAVVDEEASMLALVRAGVGLSLARSSVAAAESAHGGLIVAEHLAIETVLGFACLASKRDLPLMRCAFDALSQVWRARNLVAA